MYAHVCELNLTTDRCLTKLVGCVCSVSKRRQQGRPNPIPKGFFVRCFNLFLVVVVVLPMKRCNATFRRSPALPFDTAENGNEETREEVTVPYLHDTLMATNMSINNSKPDRDLLSASPSWSDRFATRGLRHIFLVSLLVFVILVSAGVALANGISRTNHRKVQTEALDLAIQTGDWFANELDMAILPLFSISQFALELEIFNSLPEKIGLSNETGSLPFIQAQDGKGNSHRNTTGVCDDPATVAQFIKIASAIKKNSKMEKIMVNIQLAPFGVICLIHPLNNTEDYENGQFLDGSKAVGLDLLYFSEQKFISEASMKNESIAIAGPLPLKQCPTCGNYFIARLPIVSNQYTITIDSVGYPRWGFATVLINWDELVKRSRVFANFKDQGFEFQLTRTDHPFNTSTNVYDDKVVILAESEHFATKTHEAKTALQTTNNEWVMVVRYDLPNDYRALSISITVLLAFFATMLLGMILVQKRNHAEMLAITKMHEAKVEVERSITAYFAHELRNPLSAIDSALESFTCADLPYDLREAFTGMKTCSSFMTSIMNNLLDVRDMEVGKLALRTEPLSLKQIAENTRQITQANSSGDLELRVNVQTDGRDWVVGDEQRIQQVLINIVCNAIKRTKRGFVEVVVDWVDDTVRIQCIDSGPGISIENLVHMFDRFTQRGGAPGSGLGLAISKQMVTLMKGTIRLSSDPTKRNGTTCTVLLPLAPCEKPEHEPEFLDDVRQIEEAFSILLVDDLKMNRSMLKQRLLKGIAPNCEVTEAMNGEQALLICEHQIFDFIVMDQYMEESGGTVLGTDVILTLRQKMKVTSIIIGCSGNDLDAEFFASGADFVWKKPMPSNVEIIQQFRRKLYQRQSIRRSRLFGDIQQGPESPTTTISLP